MNINWKEYLQQFDLVYEMPARVWQDGMPLGNGSLGALAYEPFHPEWTINKNDVWDYRHPAVKRHTMDEVHAIVTQDKNYAEEMARENGPDLSQYPCPKTCGQLRIRFGYDSIYAPGHRITKQLSLHEATLHTDLDKHLSHPRITSFICAEEDLLVIQVRDVSAMTAFHNKVDLYRVPDALMPDCVKGAEGDTLWIDQPFHDGFRYIMMARVVPTGGAAYSELFRETVQEKWWDVIEPSTTVDSRAQGEYAVAPVAGDFDIYLTVVTSLEAEDPMTVARERLAVAVEKGSTRLHEEHKRWWAEFWNKSYVALDESLLEQLWYVSLYNLATVLRGTPVGGLCGLWYGPMDTPSQLLPWSGSYTNDYNAQLPVMPVFRTNHPELADGSFRTLLQQLPGAQRNARELYGLPGAYYPLSADPTGEEVTNGPYRFCQNSGPYWGIFLWWHYLYTKDEDYLRQVSYPILREVATFFVNYMQWHEEEDLYHLEISQNPELMYIKYPDPIDTLVMLKYTLKATLKATQILGVDAELAERCQHVLDHYPPYPHHEKGFSPLRGLPDNHINHVRTLGGLFPCGEFDPEITNEWQKLCLDELGKMDFWSSNYGCNEGRVGGWTGLVYHLGMPACWLELRDLAWGYLENLLKTNVKPNGLISHNASILADSTRSEQNIASIPEAEIYHDLDPDPLKAVEIMTGRLMEQTTDSLDCRDTIFPAFEGPAAYLLLLGEMLLQSHNGILRLFPGLPESRNAAFVDLRAQGPSLVSAQRVDGEVTFVHLKALEGIKWKLRNPWLTPAVWRRSKQDDDASETVAERYIEIDLAPGDEVVLAGKRENLFGSDLIRTRHGESPQARCMTFEDGMLVWLGKPQPSRYYRALEAARCGR